MLNVFYLKNIFAYVIALKAAWLISDFLGRIVAGKLLLQSPNGM